ncbi:hypothetical protein SAMN06265218_10760 [Fodinibius sediminis]|uniref:Uncharacterized protein n=2 Tax=Fodinibius sediminis TaxID=1214077 RepID=A0A521CSC7_9BACT|nr:hypothetical protein SAMN06265218_10760 [Fodinibius sediminis]
MQNNPLLQRDGMLPKILLIQKYEGQYTKKLSSPSFGNGTQLSEL